MNVKKIITTGCLQLLAVAGYFFVIRPVRGWYSYFNLEHVFYPVGEWPEYLQDITMNGITVDFYYVSGGNELVYSWAPQFGFFFLLAVVGMIFFRPPIRFFLMLAAFHLIVEMAAVLSTYAGIQGFSGGFIAADFLLLYLSPLISLGFIFMAHQYQKRAAGRPEKGSASPGSAGK